MKTLVYDIAQKIKENGGRAFLVGGSVRDELLKRDVSDFDVEVFGIKEKELEAILGEFGQVLKYGKSFGIFSIAHENIDIALPRIEEKIGNKHHDFIVKADAFLPYKEASIRRDFTINALMKDILSEEILDFYGGLKDIENRVIRHIDEKRFVEDPLRVLRAARFRSTLDFDIDAKTIELCQRIDISFLTKERVKEELDKALLSKNPYFFFESLVKMWQNDYFFKELKIDNLLKERLEKGVVAKNDVHFPLYFLYAVISLDVKDKNIFLNRFTNENKLINYVLSHYDIVYEMQEINDVNQAIRILDKTSDFIDTIELLKIKYPDRINFFEELKAKYQTFIGKVFLNGDDFINMGISDGQLIKELKTESRYLMIDKNYAEVKAIMEEKCIALKK